MQASSKLVDASSPRGQRVGWAALHYRYTELTFIVRYKVAAAMLAKTDWCHTCNMAGCPSCIMLGSKEGSCSLFSFTSVLSSPGTDSSTNGEGLPCIQPRVAQQKLSRERQQARTSHTSQHISCSLLRWATSTKSCYEVFK